MKAMVIEEFGGAEALHLIDYPKPEAKDGEVLIKVAYAGVNPVDWKIREGYLTERFPHEFPIILGWDVAGTVEALGNKAQGLEVGDEVYGYIRKPIIQAGAYAEFVACPSEHIVKKPQRISLAEAAGLPLISLTAWQSLFEAAQLKKGETVLIHGASGGVGSMAVQFAKQQGAIVIATASTPKHDYVRKLGADVVIDYKTGFEQPLQAHAPEGVDVIFDCVGGNVFLESLSCLKKEGRIVSILEHLDPGEAEKRGIKAFYVFVSPSGPQLKQIAKLIEDKKVVPPQIIEMPLEDAALAQENLKEGKVFGKIVLRI